MTTRSASLSNALTPFGRGAPHALFPVVAALLLPAVALAEEDGGDGVFDHARWDRLLDGHVTEDGWIDYTAIRKRRMRELDAYLRELGAASVEGLANARERKAFWINAYNAVCVRTLIAHELPDEVPHAAFFGTNIFEERTYRIAGKKRTLDEIEHEILRKRFRDSRIHAALVCGASSCPRLRPEAYTGKDIDAQLDEECRRWINAGRDLKGRRKNRLDRGERVFYASKIFDWFQEDFGDSDEGVLRFVKRFIEKEDREFLETHEVDVSYLDYDWSLNAQPRGR